MSKGKNFAARLIRGSERFKPDSSLLSSLKETGATNSAIRSHICNFQLPSIRLPEHLDRAAIEILKEVNLAPQELSKRASTLTHYLWQRSLPIEGERKRELYRRFTENQTRHAGIPIDEDADDVEKMDKSLIQKLVNMEMKNWRPLKYSSRVSEVYLVAKLAPNFAVACRVLHEIRKRCPDFHPTSLFDFGSGLGTVAWAANSVWPEGSLQEHFLVDTSPSMLRISEQLLRDGHVSDQFPFRFPGVSGRQFLPASPEPKYNLVVAAGSLIDIGMSMARKKVLQTLWEKTGNFLVVIENGTSAGFQAVLEARDFILLNYGPDVTEDVQSAAHIFSPCPHSFTCPKAESVCNFYATYQNFRLITTRETYAKEVFSYVIFSKGPPPVSDMDDLTLSRIVSYKPTKKSKFILHDVCTKEGSVNRVIFTKDKTDKFLYRMLSKGVAGDRVPAELQPMNAAEEGNAGSTDFEDNAHEGDE